MSASRYRTFLVALDTSPRAGEVLATSIELARDTGATLILFRAVGIPRDLPPEAFTESPARLPEILRERALKELEAMASDVPAELFSKALAEVGNPWQSICGAAEREDVDLIVLGSHGFSGIDKLIGTTAARVVNHADRPVLVVRGPDARKKG